MSWPLTSTLDCMVTVADSGIQPGTMEAMSTSGTGCPCPGNGCGPPWGYRQFALHRVMGQCCTTNAAIYRTEEQVHSSAFAFPDMMGFVIHVYMGRLSRRCVCVVCVCV